MKERPEHNTDSSRPADPRVETVVISNVYGDANKGGAAITELTVAFARRLLPEARLVLITVPSNGMKQSPSDQHSNNSHNRSVHIPPLLSTPGGLRTAVGLLKGAIALLIPQIFRGSHPGLSEVANARIVISKGGYLFGHRSGVRSILGLVSTSFPLLYAWRLRVPTVAYSTSVGPFSGFIHRWATGLILRRLTVVMVRDSDSEQRAIKLGVMPSRLVLMPDCVFSWRPAIESANASERPSASLAVVLREMKSLRDFLPALESVIVRSHKEGIFSTFQVVVQSHEDRPITNQFADRLHSLGLNAEVADPALDPPSALLKTYSGSAATISARLHGAIFSMLAGTPAIALSADPSKAEGVMTEVGLRDWVLPLDPDTADDLFNRVVEATHTDTTATVRKQVERAAQRVSSAEMQAKSLLEPFG